MADFNQAIKWMQEGKKVKRELWSGQSCLYLVRPEDPRRWKFEGEIENGTSYYSLLATDWEVC